MLLVSRMTGSFSTGLCAVLALMGQCHYAHRSVLMDLRLDEQIPELTAHVREAQAEPFQRFIEESSTSSGDQPMCYGEWIS
jgi:hypothetical protein